MTSPGLSLWRLRTSFRHLVSLDTPEWAIIRGFFGYAIDKISCLYALFSWSRYLTLVPLNSNRWFIIIVSGLNKPVLPYRQNLKKVQIYPPPKLSQHIHPGNWNAAGPQQNTKDTRLPGMLTYICIKLVTLVVCASFGCTSKAYIGYYTRGEFNNARARRALVDWYLSLFVMCKAWHQYNER